MSVVPEGYQVRIVVRQHAPALVTVGEALVVELGLSSDAWSDQWSELFGALKKRRQEPLQPATLVTEAAGLDELLTPERPATADAKVLAWVVDPDDLGRLPDATGLVQRLLRQIHLCRRTWNPQTHVMFVPQPPQTDPGKAVVALVHGLGVQIHALVQLDEGGAASMLEVQRPDGPVMGLIGPRLEVEADPIAATLNARRDAHPGKDGKAKRRELQVQELTALKERLDSDPGSVFLAHNLVRRLLAASEDSSEHPALAQHLASRIHPLLAIVKPGQKGLPSVQVGNRPPAIAVYPDRATLLRAAEEQGLELGGYGVAHIPPGGLIESAVAEKTAVALGFYRDDAARFVVLTPDVLAG